MLRTLAALISVARDFRLSTSDWASVVVLRGTFRDLDGDCDCDADCDCGGVSAVVDRVVDAVVGDEDHDDDKERPVSYTVGVDHSSGRFRITLGAQDVGHTRAVVSGLRVAREVEPGLRVRVEKGPPVT